LFYENLSEYIFPLTSVPLFTAVALHSDLLMNLISVIELRIIKELLENGK